MPKSLNFSPLSSLHADGGDTQSVPAEREGFVDENVVRSLLCRTSGPRVSACPEDLALTADDSDFAGWQLTHALPRRAAEVPPPVIDAIIRRATFPVPGRPEPARLHSSRHRWWLAGVAGVLCTLLFSLLLFTFATRQAVQPRTASETLPTPRPVAIPRPLPADHAPPAELSSGLSETFFHQP